MFLTSSGAFKLKFTIKFKSHIIVELLVGSNIKELI
jgi:hypothetical protein